MQTITLTRDNFKHTIEHNPFVIVLFTADWCDPCKTFEPIFNAQASNQPDIVFGTVNVEDEPFIAEYFNIQQVPAMLAIRATIIVDGIHGLLNAVEFAQMIRVWENINTTEINRHFSSASKQTNPEITPQVF